VEKGTRSVSSVGVRRRPVVVGADDPSVTARAGLSLVAEVDRVLGVTEAFESSVGWLKARRRGLGIGEVLTSMAESMLADGDFMCDLDHLRADRAGAPLRAVPEAPAASTFALAAGRLDDRAVAGIERGMGTLIGRWFQAMPSRRRSQLVACRPTIDLDGTDVEVYGSKKERVAWNHEGRRVGRPHPATWAEAGVILAGDLGSGADDPRPAAAGLIARAVTNLPAGLGRPRVRADAGYFDAKVAAGALAAGADYAIAAKRNRAAWRAVAALDEDAWEDCVGMRGAQAAVCGYVPGGWPEGTRTVVRRVRLEPDQVRADPRSRRRRTIRADQLALALAGETTDIYAYSFICTNLDGTAEAIEYWFRERAWIEERHRDSKLGYALVHLPSGSWRVNQAWMWSAYLATNLSAFTQTLGRVDHDGVRAHAKRARRQLFCLPARVVSHARRVVVRFAAGSTDAAFATAWENLRALPTAPAG
jgi:hypothetical protein